MRSSTTPHSIRVRLPLLISLLIVAAVATFLWEASREVEAALVLAGKVRATAAAERLSSLLERNAKQLADDARQAAMDPDVRRFVESPSGERRDAARARLAVLAAGDPRRIELWNAAGSRLLDLAVPATDGRLHPEPVPAGTRPTASGFSALEKAGAFVVYDLVTAVGLDAAPGLPAASGGALGYVVVRSPLSVTPPDALDRLAGPEAEVGIGNATGGTWTNLATIVPAPPAEVLRHAVAEFRAPDSGRRLGAMSAVRGTPWAVWVHFPRAAVIAPAQAFQRRMTIVALTFVAVGALLVLGLSIRITSPIHELAHAADQIAAGDYSRRVTPTRRDEIGQLGRAFNDMAQSVSEARRQLEGQILERKRAEEDRLRNQVMEAEHRRMVEASRLKNEFLANMSHELRTPLNAIIGFAELMDSGKAGPASPGHKPYLGYVLVSARHLLQLINDVLDHAKVESGKMDFHPQRVHLPSLVAEVGEIVLPLVAVKGLGMTLDVDPQLTTVVVDAARVKQILYNFLSNAIKFTPDGGRVAVRVTPCDAGMFRIDVEDSGIGIAAEDVESLFVRFHQLNAAAPTENPGTGLGLSLTKQLAEGQGGRVMVTSVPGKGSTFSAILPREAGSLTK